MKKYKFQKFIVILALTIVMLPIGGTYAYMKWTSAVNNSFTYEQTAQPIVADDFSVSAGDTEYSVYIRAAIQTNWVNDAKEILATAPELTYDYNITYNLAGDGWFDGGDGFYYYSKPVLSGESTPALISSYEILDTAPVDGYVFHLDIIAQTIQSAGETDAGLPIVTAAWGRPVNASNYIE